MTLREMREAAGLTQEATAKLVGVSQPTISAVEIGVTVSPRMNVVIGLASAFGRTVDEVVAAIHESARAAGAAALVGDAPAEPVVESR